MKGTICIIYRSSRETELYLYIDKNIGLDKVPEDLLTRMGNMSEVMTLLITPEKKLARVKSVQVLEDIKEKGYFLQLPPTFNPQVFTYGE
ncbi:YcgL domain-containing protein [Gammaproteobacteria bacterium]|nr:YcgL domain-containing protein [Gammaproteobacteria bacterium]